jgi:hypothetical protein
MSTDERDCNSVEGAVGTVRLHEEVVLLEKYASLTKHEITAKSTLVSLITTLIRVG